MTRRTGTISVRLDEELLNELRKESTKDNTSINAVINTIVKEYMEWHRFAVKTGFVVLPKPLLVRIMDRISEKELTRATEFLSKSEVKGLTILMRKKWDVFSFLEGLESWARASGLLLVHGVDGDMDVFILRHEMGLKWSKFIGAMLRSLLQELVPKQFQLEVNNDDVCFKIGSKQLRDIKR